MRRALVVIALVLAGCGGSSSPPPLQQVSTTLKDYLHLQATGEPAQACALLTTGAQQRLIAFIKHEAAKTPLASGNMTCDQAIGLVRLAAGTDLLTAMRDADVMGVRVTGDHATAVVVGTGDVGRRTVKLVREGGDWKILAVPGLGG